MNVRSFFFLTSERSFIFIKPTIKNMNTKHTIATASILAAVTLANAAGYQILEQGASNMGNAVAGAAVNANQDATCAFWNPSSAAFMPLEVGQTRVDAGVFGVIPTLWCTGTQTSNPYTQTGPNKEGDCSADSVVPQLYVAHKFSDRIDGTLSITAPWGLESDYNKDWIGGFQALHSYLMTVDINPSISFKVTDWLAVSGGVSAQYAYCRLTNAVPAVLGGGDQRFSGDDVAVGGNIGFTIKYAENGRIGFHWRSAVEHELKGTARGTLYNMSISADMHMPNTFDIGWYQRLDGDLRKFAIMAEYSYMTWSQFEDLTIPEAGVYVEENWKDTSRISVGFHYYPEYIEDLTLRFGVCYDESPIRNAELRTPRIPCSDRLWLSTGIGYKFGNYSIDLCYSYIFVLGDGEMSRTENAGTPLQNTLSGNYAAHIHVVGAQFGVKF